MLTYTTAAQTTPADLTLQMPKAALPALLGGERTAEGLTALGVEADGDLGAAARLVACLDSPDPDFDIVTP